METTNIAKFIKILSNCDAVLVNGILSEIDVSNETYSINLTISRYYGVIKIDKNNFVSLSLDGLHGTLKFRRNGLQACHILFLTATDMSKLIE